MEAINGRPRELALLTSDSCETMEDPELTNHSVDASSFAVLIAIIPVYVNRARGRKVDLDTIIYHI